MPADVPFPDAKIFIGAEEVPFFQREPIGFQDDPFWAEGLGAIWDWQNIRQGSDLFRRHGFGRFCVKRHLLLASAIERPKNGHIQPGNSGPRKC